MEQDKVVIIGFGLLTPIGQTFWHTMLSLRAKRSCYQEHETVLVADSPSGAILRGATVSRVAHRLIPRDLAGAHRAAALLAFPVMECLSGFPLESRRRLVWDVITRYAGSWEVVRDEFAEWLPEVNLCTDSFCWPRAIRSEFFGRIANAAESLLANRVESVLVTCADSLCDPLQLEELLHAGLLKDAANPYGIMASEAAGAVLLERKSTARRRGAPILAVICAWGGASEPHPWPTGSPSTAQAHRCVSPGPCPP